MDRLALNQLADTRLMQQGQWKVTETLNIHHTDYKPGGMLLRHRTCFSVCVYESEWVGEDMAVGTSRCGDRGCRMGGLEYRWKGRWREWRSCCSVTQSLWAGWVEPSLSVLPPSSLFISLDLSLSLITHFLVQTVRLPGFSLVSSAVVMKNKNKILGTRKYCIFSSLEKETIWDPDYIWKHLCPSVWYVLGPEYH